MAKRMGKSMKRDIMDMNGMHMGCCCGHGSAKLATAAFVLFLITVWPGLLNLVLRIHWGWFLGATVLFCLWHWKMHMMHCKM